MKKLNIALLFLLLYPVLTKAVTDSIPRPDHVVIIIMENRAYSQTIGDTNLKYLNFLADSGASFTQSYGLFHPSVRNYLALYSGSDQGVPAAVSNPSTGFPYKTANLGNSLIKAGFTFKGYSENLKYPGYSGGDTAGYFARRHCPWIYWEGTDSNQIDSMLSVSSDSFPSDYSKLPTLSFLTPALTHDLHNDTTAKGKVGSDTWIKNKIGGYATWALTHNSLLIVTFDEDDNKHNNQIYTVFYGQKVIKGKYSEHITNYNLLRTFEKFYGLTPPMGNFDTTQKVIADCWDTSHKVIDTTTKDTTITGIQKLHNGYSISIYPNPANSILYLDIFDELSPPLKGVRGMTTARVYVSDLSGKIILNQEIQSQQTSIDISTLPPSIYLIRYQDNEKVWNGKFVKQ